MRIQVSVFGRLQTTLGRAAPALRVSAGLNDTDKPMLRGLSCARMQVIIKGPGERRADTLHLFEFCHAGSHHPLQSPEMLEQRPALRGAEARNGLEHRFGVAA